jgi:hypothetical protein
MLIAKAFRLGRSPARSVFVLGCYGRSIALGRTGATGGNGVALTE